MKSYLAIYVSGLLLFCADALAQSSFQQTQADSYTRYELLAPSSQSFRIVYDVSATSTGASYYFNTLRKGSEHTVDAVFDLMTGEELSWRIVDGVEAKKNGHERANEDGRLRLSFVNDRPDNIDVHIVAVRRGE